MIRIPFFRFSFKKTSASLLVLLLFIFAPALITAAEAFSAWDLLNLRSCTSAAISPDGKWIAYTVSFQREPDEESGPSYSNLYLVSTASGEIKPFITGKHSVSSPQWSTEGKEIGFLMARGEKAKTQVWIIPAAGGEAFPATEAKTDIIDFRWNPDGSEIAYIATTPATEKEEKLAKKGYNFIFYEENLKHRNLYLIKKKKDGGFGESRQVMNDITLWSLEYSPDGKKIAISASQKNLVDYQYMFSKVYLVDPFSGEVRQITNNPGKLGNYAISPDGTRLVYTAAKTLNDHAVSQLYVINISGGEAKNLTPDNFKGHIVWAGWKNNDKIIYLSDEGVWNYYNLVSADGRKREVILNSKDQGLSIGSPRYTKNFEHFTFIGSSPSFPSEVFYWRPDAKVKRLTISNSWLAERKLGGQEIVRYKARDGWDVEGLLIYPIDYKQGNIYPMIVIVHGGPESNYSNGWLTRYSEAGQVLSGKGYIVFYPNYRASTGYGLDFALAGFGDPAGKEFDDIADGIDYLISKGLADKQRVGLAGGSYGGYAAAWFGSYYTDYVKAVVMFVGISDLISKEGTTDIPYEDLYVHMGKKLEDAWDLMLKRSPVYYAYKSKTAVLIVGGASDTRVHPSQSIEFYRRLKINNHPAARLVQYPGEGHGNRNQTSRIDLLFRHLQWFDWYVMDGKPLDGPMPALDISDSYGIKLEN